jgi:hypothetical protein
MKRWKARRMQARWSRTLDFSEKTPGDVVDEAADSDSLGNPSYLIVFLKTRLSPQRDARPRILQQAAKRFNEKKIPADSEAGLRLESNVPTWGLGETTGR